MKNVKKQFVPTMNNITNYLVEFLGYALNFELLSLSYIIETCYFFVRNGVFGCIQQQDNW